MAEGVRTAERGAASPPAKKEADSGPKEFLKYTFYKAGPAWHALAPGERAQMKAAFAGELKALARKYALRPYSLVGLRGDADFMTWAIAESAESLEDVARRLGSTDLGRRFETPYSYLGMRRKSVYLGEHQHAGQEGAGAPKRPVGSKFVFVYPFTKKREWYGLPFEERSRMMRDHFRIGHKFPKITIHTGYSFGIDDYEFILAFEGDDPGEFLDLVMELRPTEASRYTALETPIFICRSVTADELMASLGE